MSKDAAMQEDSPAFFFGAMSPYSWLAAERIDGLLPEARWRGVLAGVIFTAHGRTSWGLTDERERGQRDCEQRALAHGLGPIRWPEPWPTSDLRAARAMVLAERHGVMREFSLAAMRVAFLEGADLEQIEVVLDAGARVGLAGGELESALADPLVKQTVRKTNEEALAVGVFGVPSVIVDGEVFWGDDRLDDAAAAYRAHERG
jgi:2-hydroxychromene-2-carboxylate isomerase